MDACHGEGRKRKTSSLTRSPLMILLSPPSATKVNSLSNRSITTEMSSTNPNKAFLHTLSGDYCIKLYWDSRQYASNKQPKEEIPVYMTHCFEQILTLAGQHFLLYHFSRLPKSYIILQSRQYRQNKLDKRFGLLISLPTASVNLFTKKKKKIPSIVTGLSYSEKY